jgi:ketosteroid isomerase-like protein
MTGTSEADRVELMQRAWDAYNAGEVDAVIELLDPEVEVYSSPELANPGTFRGVDEFVRWMTRWNDAWGSFHFDAVETVPVGEHHVATRMRQTGVGRGSGLEVAMDAGWVAEVRDGRCVHLGLYPSFEVAIAVARKREGIAIRDA